MDTLEKHFDRFWSRINKKNNDDCWLWKGRTNPDGYGYFDYNYIGEGAHRFMWRISFGEIPDGLEVCHSCDNPPCVNPNHLFLGTHQDNIKDRDMKGRQASHKGIKNGRAVVTESDVLVIRELRKSGLEYQQIADNMGVSTGCINHILNGRHWAWVK